MKIKIVAVLFTCLALTACKVENKEGDTVVKPEPVKKESTTTIIDKSGSSTSHDTKGSK